MLKLLAIDDQRKDLEGICRILKWDDLGIEICGKATNGLEGLQLAIELKPDIIITDVIMPIMDGLAMQEEILKTIPDTKFIITSCYSDFNYAKKALDLKTVGYVLKPIIASDLLKVVEKALNICFAEKQKAIRENVFEERLQQNIPSLRENFLRRLFLGLGEKVGNIGDDLGFLGIDIHNDIPLCMLYIEVDEYAEIVSSHSTRDRNLLLENVKSIIDEHFTKKGLGYPVSIDESHVAVLAKSNGNILAASEDKYFYDLASALANDIKLQAGVSITVGMSPTVSNLEDASMCYKLAQDASKLKFKIGKGQIIKSIDLQEIGINIPYNADNLLQEIKTLLLSDSTDNIASFVDKLASSTRSHEQINYFKVMCISVVNYTQILLMEMKEEMKSIFGDENTLYCKLFNLETIEDIKQWIQNILTETQSFIYTKNTMRNHRVVEKIKDMVEMRYATALAIADIAHDIFLSPSYTSYIFKKASGVNFTEYLTQVRIRKSMEFLGNRDLKIYQVAELVGYDNKSYFCSVFKEKTGFTPSEYREKLWY